MDLEKKIFQINSSYEFNELALEIFQFQYDNNQLYRSFVNALGVNHREVNKIKDIPFLPISFFKNHHIKTGSFTEEKLFLSSGTTQSVRSKHFVKSLKLYEESFLNAFQLFFDHPSNLVVLCLLPSYQEQGDSSLLYMTDTLIKKSQNPKSGYFLNENKRLYKTIELLEEQKQKFVLFGVSYALLDYIDQFKHQIKYGKIIETGGMKGRRKELTKEQLHHQLKNGFGTTNICSEYGMTELLSQAYSLNNQEFQFPNWMDVLVRDITDPQTYLSYGKTGLLDIIDLANIYSCSFIATDDIGVKLSTDVFKVKGRYDLADIRGCNLLVQ